LLGFVAACLAIIMLSGLIHSCDKANDNPVSVSKAEVLKIYIDKNGTITHIHVEDINQRPKLEVIVEALKKMEEE